MTTEKKYNPPVLARWLLEKSYPEYDQSFLAGDFKEIFRQILEVRGRPAAVRWCWA